jgi:hypothetical protein
MVFWRCQQVGGDADHANRKRAFALSAALNKHDVCLITGKIEMQRVKHSEKKARWILHGRKCRTEMKALQSPSGLLAAASDPFLLKKEFAELISAKIWCLSEIARP